MAEADLRQRREQTVRDHMALETALDFDAVIATFEHPRYELIGSSTEFDGEADVRRYFALSRMPFPDQSNEIIALRSTDDAVLAEFWLIGTHLGPLKQGDRIVAPTGRSFRVRMAAVFEFPEGGDRIVCERVYFDRQTLMEQLGLA